VGELARVAPPGPADADPKPQEVGRAELPGDRLEPVVAGEAAATAGLETSEVQVALVVHDEDRVRVDLEEARRSLHRAARVVHVRLGLEQRDLVSVDANFGELARELAAPRAAGAPRELVDDHPADVVPVSDVRAAGVAEP